jgi:predicted alpha/beta-hydrolase family hydrolase
VHGAADPFGSIEALREAVALIPAAAQIIPVGGAGHDLKRGRFDAAAAVAALLASAG